MDILSYYAFRPKIAYFSMEIALRPEVHTYSGGLGVLAGDSLRSAADLELPMVFVTQISRSGYIKQGIDSNGKQTQDPDPWEPYNWATPLRAKVAITIENRDVWILPWLYVCEGVTGYKIPVLLLDTNLKENSVEDQKITDVLYGNGDAYRLKQEMVLGIGGIRILRALGLAVSTYHLNEGHSALLALELLRSFTNHGQKNESVSGFDVAKVQEHCVFTTHTPVEAGHDRFSFDMFHGIASEYIDANTLKRLCGGNELNMTCLALNLSGRINGVSMQHQKLAKQQFPAFKVDSITNGVHPYTWASPPFADLYSKYLPEWRHQPTVLARADQIPNSEIWQAHMDSKDNLANYLQKRIGVKIDHSVFTIGFARRMTGYKRPDLLFKDLQRLKAINQRYPIQIVLAGKAHPKDQRGIELIKILIGHINTLKNDISIVYIEDYDMEVAQYLIPGVDIWLNTPKPPMEASGTSGIKAAFNGVPHLSVLDGWWIEGHIEGVTGWSIEYHGNDDEDAHGLYSKLAETILPLYYQKQSEWQDVMKSAISKNSRFNSHHMMRRYVAEAYIS